MGYAVNATLRPLYPWGRDPFPILQVADWAPGPVRKGAKNLAYIKKCVPFTVSSSTATVSGMSRQMQALCVMMLFRLGPR